MERILLIGMLIVPFLGAYLFYRVLFFLFYRLSRSIAWVKKLLDATRKPILFIFLELVGLVTLNLVDIPYVCFFRHALLVLLIATIGFCCFKGARALYFYICEKHQTEKLEDFEDRSLLTQAQILYRAALFVIIMITVSTILMTFPTIKSFGIGILGSAGIAGIAVGFAARPILLNFIAGFQIAFTKMLKIGDQVVVEGENGRVEKIFLTHVIIKIWDQRRMILPISYFIDKPFQNWSCSSTELLAVVRFPCDYQISLKAVKEKVLEILQSTTLWNKRVWSVDLVNVTDRTAEVRILMSANDPQASSTLEYLVREKILDFLQKNRPEELPKFRYKEI